MRIRKPAVAGRFYPAHPATLRKTIEDLLGAVRVESAPERVSAVIVPHAGYPYSGATAAHAFRRLQDKSPGRVVLLGCSHRFGFEDVSLSDSSGFETPLGVVLVDEEFTAYLAESYGWHCPEAHGSEHALEVQIPFLQTVLRGKFKLVPVLFGSRPDALHRNFGTQLAESLEEGDLVLASTDLSHFLCENEANKIDQFSLEKVLSRDEGAVCDGAANESSMCGVSAVVAAMAYANATGVTDWQLLDYRTSAWASGDTSRVVGYGAISMERELT